MTRPACKHHYHDRRKRCVLLRRETPMGLARVVQAAMVPMLSSCRRRGFVVALCVPPAMMQNEQ